MTKPGPSVTSGADTQPGSDSLFPSGFGGGSLIRSGGVGTTEIADGSIALVDLSPAVTNTLPLTTPAVSTATTGTLTVGATHRLDATGAPLARTLPSAASAGAGGIVIVKKVDATSNAATVTASGADTINVSGSTRTLTLPREAAHFRSDGVSDWTVVASDTPVTQLDSRYDARYVTPATGNGTYGRVVLPSGDATGVTDRTAFNAALAAGGRTRGIPGSAYYFDAPIYMQSNTELDVTGCTLNLVGANPTTNLLRNRAVDATRTLTDGAATATSANLTSATANFTNGDVGASVSLTAAGAGGSIWYGTISSVTNSTTAVVSNAADVTVSGKTLTIFGNRDSNITVRGGKWVTGAYADGHQASSTAFNTFASCLRRIDGLLIENTTWQTGGTQAQGGKFTVSLGDVTNATVRNTYFVATAGDGVHVQGPATDVNVHDTAGTTGDDMVVFNCQDSNTPTILDTQGSLTRVQARGIKAINSWRCFKIYDLGTVAKFTVTQCGVDGVFGSSQNDAVTILGNSIAADGIWIRNVSATVGSNTKPTVLISGVGRTTGMLIENITWTAATNSAVGIVQVDSPRGPFTIRNIRMATAPSSTNVGVYITGSLAGSTFGCAIDIDGLYCIKGTVAAPASFHPVFLTSITGTTNATQLTLRNVVAEPGSLGSLLNVSASAPLGDVSITDCKFAGANLIATPTGNTALNVRIANTSFVGTSLASLGGPSRIELDNVDVNTTAAVIAAVGASATPIRVLAGNFTQAGAGAGISRDGTQSIRVQGAAFPVDLDLLTPTQGDMAYNSNATATSGSGTSKLGLYGYTGSAWTKVFGPA